MTMWRRNFLNSGRLCWIALCLGLLGSARGVDAVTDWPQFRGPDRDSRSAETGLLTEWPDEGPRRIWEINAIGLGFASPVITNGRLYIAGDRDDDCVIQAYSLDGAPVWAVANGKAWKASYRGARSSGVVEGDRLYQVNGHGRLVCLNIEDGSEVWAVNILERFEGDVIKWGISECPLIDGDRLIVAPGGRKALVVALDKKTGETVWAGEPLRFKRIEHFGGKKVDPPEDDIDCAGYSSLLPMDVAGRRLVFGCSGRHFYCVDLADGSILWKQYVPTRHDVIGAIPATVGADMVLFSAPVAPDGSCLIRVTAQGDETLAFQKVWSGDVDNCHGGFVVLGDRIIGSGYREQRGWSVMDAATGKNLHLNTDLANGAGVYADGAVYGYGEDGMVSLLRLDGDRFTVKGQFSFAKTRSDAWAHPVIWNRRLFIRYHERLACFDLKAP